jgi:predicted house-cleaning noncanonical NTP pyrophosphatase (MazG superfamily)
MLAVPKFIVAGGALDACDVASVGAKAVQLHTLPDGWTPPFFVVTSEAYAAWAEAVSSAPGSPDVFQRLHPTLHEQLHLIDADQTGVIVRSSVPDESLSERGRYDSLKCSSNPHDVADTILSLWTSFRSAMPTRMTALIVQKSARVQIEGHLSNERRVSRRSNQWFCEFRQLPGPVAEMTFRCPGRHGELTGRLRCTDKRQLEAALKIVASVSRAEQRMHYEWVWDGDTLWIVQKDVEPHVRSRKPGSDWQISTRATKQPELSVLVSVDSAVGSWKKVSNVRQFSDAGLPTTSLWILEDPATLDALQKGEVTDALRQDLAQLIARPVVIRTDSTAKDPAQRLLLPRSDCILNLDQAIAFLLTSATRWVEEVAYCFIFHHFIAATGCAQALAWPGIGRVRIDSTWGISDGLQFFPHDTFEVNIKSSGSIRRRIRAKTTYLDVDAMGNWVEVNTGSPWDWRDSLTPTQALEIARYTAALARHLNHPVDVMFFVDVLMSGTPTILPWYYTEGLPQEPEKANEARYSSSGLTVRNDDDLKAFQDNRSGETSPHIILRPSVEHLRDRGFIDRVADAAIAAHTFIELSGSTLSHAYYLLRARGARVKCVDYFAPGLKSQKFGKLVRDLVPLKILRNGENVIIDRVSPAQLTPLLKAKLVEEALEVFSAEGKATVTEELADLLEVMRSLSDSLGLSFDELARVAAAKKEERGGFDRGIVLLETSDVPLLRRRQSTLFEPNDIGTKLIETDGTSRLAKARRPREAGENAVIVPLVPPQDGTERSDEMVVPLRGGLYEAVILYEGKQVLVEVRQRTSLASDPAQYQLPFQ